MYCNGLTQERIWHLLAHFLKINESQFGPIFQFRLTTLTDLFSLQQHAAVFTLKSVNADCTQHRAAGRFQAAWLELVEIKSDPRERVLYVWTVP